MGNLCDCLGGQSKNEPPRSNASETTPLLHGGPVSQPAKSARSSRPKARSTGNPLDDLTPVEMRDCRLTSINKLFADHAKLFNNILEKRTSLVEELVLIKSEIFPDNPSVSLIDCFKEIKKQCDERQANPSLVRKFKYCMEISYESKQFSGSESVISAFVHFNVANMLTREILDKSLSVADSIQIVVKDEDQLRRDILTASLGASGPQCLKNCNENITDLRKLPGLLESMMKDAERIFEELKTGVQPLLSEA